MKFTYQTQTAKTSLKATKSDANKTLIVFMVDKTKWSKLAHNLDPKAKKQLDVWVKSQDFTGAHGSFLSYPGLGGWGQVIVTGLGKVEELSTDKTYELGGKLYDQLAAGKAKDVIIVCPDDLLSSDDAESFAADLAYGMTLKSYRFDRYKTKLKAKDKPSLQSVTLRTAQLAQNKKRHVFLSAVADGVFETRDLVSEPANVLYPNSYAARIKKLFPAKSGVKVTVYTEAQLKKMNFHALLSVGQGSDQPSAVVVMEYQGAAKSKKPLALVGKGVTFDTGGISIKPSKGMGDMKFDMGGSGVVVGAMLSVSKFKPKENVIGIVGLVENMPSSKAYRPGDVINSLSGQTIEVLNTDAEGRLVLADCLTYVQRKYKPAQIIDLATLTGAMIVALDDEYAGIFGNNDDLAERLTAAGHASNDKVWRLPMHVNYNKQMDSPIADMKNIGNGGAGSITAAEFLGRFVENNTPWMHIDIAGVTWANSPKPYVPKGATGYGVHLLSSLIGEL